MMYSYQGKYVQYCITFNFGDRLLYQQLSKARVHKTKTKSNAKPQTNQLT